MKTPEIVAWTNETNIEHLRNTPHTGAGFKAKGQEEMGFRCALVRLDDHHKGVEGLVEALEQLREPINIASMEYDGKYEKYVELIDTALAAHRQQKGDAL